MSLLKRSNVEKSILMVSGDEPDESRARIRCVTRRFSAVNEVNGTKIISLPPPAGFASPYLWAAVALVLGLQLLKRVEKSISGGLQAGKR